MTWYPIAFLPPQYDDGDGVPYSGAVLKAYRESTSTVISMATSYEGTTLSSSIPLNEDGYPVYGSTIIIPHIQENYDLALYPDQASADANSGALWTVSNIQIADTENEAFFQSFSGDNSTVEFTLSEDLGTDEKTIMVFADLLDELVTNGDFDEDEDWTKGTGWTIADGVASGASTTASLEQNAAILIHEGESYNLTFTVSDYSSGTVTPYVGGTAGTGRTANGTYTETIVAGSTQLITFTGTSTFTGNLDDISLTCENSSQRKILRPDEYTLEGTTLTLYTAPQSGTKNVLVFAPSLLFGAVGAAAAAAATSEANADASAAAAALSAAKLQGTSTTSVLIGTGSKSFTTQADKFFTAGNFLTITSEADVSNYMFGQVTSYSSTALTVNIISQGGSGTYADWSIQVAGDRGPQGPTGTISGASSGTLDKADKMLFLDTSDSDALVYQSFEDMTASQAEAEAGIVDNKIMTPERVGEAITALSSGLLKSTQLFTSSGTWVKPTGINTILVKGVAGGGGGGGAESANTSNRASAGGGGGGGYFEKLIDVSAISSETITIGSGGSGGDGGTGATGSSGGTTSFGSHCSATGGSGGEGTGALATTEAITQGGVGGSGSGGDINSDGNAGCGSSAGASHAVGGSGGGSYFGGGARGGRITGVGQNSSGVNASGYGSGGGGAANSDGAGSSGGSGSNGFIVVYEYS